MRGWIFCFSSGIDGRVTEICGYADLFFLKSLEKYQDIFEILENFRLCLIQRTLEELPDFEVMTWQLCRMLRSALNCFQVTRFCVQK